MLTPILEKITVLRRDSEVRYLGTLDCPIGQLHTATATDRTWDGTRAQV
jgi:hypothetical protein